MNNEIKQVIAYFFAIILLMSPAFYNGFPLVYTDTGTYIGSGFDLVIPSDRPIMYGLFVKFFSLGISLWFVIFFQSLIVIYVIWHLCKLILGHISYKVFLLILIILICTTGLGWYSSQIMPDIFSTVAIFCVPLLLYYKQNSKLQNSIYTTIIILAINVHFTNFLIIGGILIFVYIANKIKLVSENTRKQVNFSLCVTALIFSVSCAFLVNFLIDGRFKINQGSHVFIMGKMLDSGALKSFLDDNCKNENYILCSCKDSLPEDNRKLLCDDKSPLYKNGGWDKTSNSYNKIITGIITSPKHLCMFIQNATTSSISQLFQNDIGSGLICDYYADPISPPYFQISKHFQHELNQYKQSRQNINLWDQKLDFSFINSINHVLMIMSSVFLFVILMYQKTRALLSNEFKLMIIVLLLGLIINAIVTASLSNVCDRFQARVSWFIIFIALLVIIKYWKLLFINLKQIIKH